MAAYTKEKPLTLAVWDTLPTTISRRYSERRAETWHNIGVFTIIEGTSLRMARSFRSGASLHALITDAPVPALFTFLSSLDLGLDLPAHGDEPALRQSLLVTLARSRGADAPVAATFVWNETPPRSSEVE